MKFTVNFDDSELKKLKRKAGELHGEHEVSMPDLFTDDFIRQHTDFKTLQEMVDTCGIEQMKKQTDEFAKFIATRTRFNTWDEMVNEAGLAYIKRQLGL